MEIIAYKLINGDIVMGRHDQENSPEGARRLLKPMTLMLDPLQGGVGLMPYDFVFTHEELDWKDFKEEHIMHDIKVHSSFEEAYIKHTSGIEIVS